MQESNPFEERLSGMIAKVQQCQKDKNLDSCMKCDILIGCDLRKEYVQTTYESMS